MNPKHIARHEPPTLPGQFQGVGAVCTRVLSKRTHDFGSVVRLETTRRVVASSIRQPHTRAPAHHTRGSLAPYITELHDFVRSGRLPCICGPPAPALGQQGHTVRTILLATAATTAL